MKASIAALYPATPAQQGFVLGTLTNPGTAVFTEQTIFELRGQLDPARLQGAADALVADHEILRTGFAWDLATDPHQVVLEEAPLTVEFLDSSTRTPPQQQAVLTALAYAQHVMPFDFNRPPLLRLAVHTLTPARHQLVWTHHHSILDGWAHLLLVTELLHHYNTRAAPSPGLRSFGAYAEWLTELPREAAQTHWTRQLDGYAPLAPLAPQRPQAGTEAGRFGQNTRVLTGQCTEALTFFTQAHGITEAAALVACWSLIAARYRNRDDIAVGVTVSGRTHPYPDAERVAGPLATTVPLRTSPDPHEHVGAWISRVHTDLAHADQHSLCSTAELYTWAKVPEGQALYDSVIAIANYPFDPPTGSPDGTEEDGLTLETAAIRGQGGRTRQAMTLVVEPSDGLRLRLVNDRAQVTDSQASAALEALCALLEHLKPGTDATVATLTGALSALPVFTERPPRIADGVTPDDQRAREPLVDVIAGHFSELLGQPAGPDTDFLQAGGHSLLALRLVTSLRSALAVDLTLSAVFEAPTPASLARHVLQLIAKATDGPPPPLPNLPAFSEEDDQPFALTGIQQAYWAGRRVDFHLGGVDSHLYTEADVPDLDLKRLAAVWQLLIARHPMLRAVITADGRQRTLADVPPYDIRTWDLRQAPDAEGELQRLRERLSHPRRDTSVWPLFTVEAALLPDQRTTRLFLSFDLLIGDALSWQILYREARTLYDQPAAKLPELHTTFAAYVGHQQAISASSRYARDRKFWRDRLTALPAPPPLPVLRAADAPARFTREQITYSLSELTQLRAVAAAHGVTLSALLLAAFNETLRRFTNSSQFLINVTVYNRPSIHPQINSVVGDFTSTVLTSVDLSGATFADRLRALQRQLWAGLDHATYSGVEVLRDLRERTEAGAGAPVVFTSTLDLQLPGTPPAPLPGSIVYGIGQTPQVLLDYQTYEAAGRLVINLDSVRGALPDAFVEAMLDDHAVVLRCLLDDPTAPQHPRLVAPDAAASLPAALGGDQLLHEPFLDRVRTQPERTALICDGQHYTYAELHAQARTIADQVTAARPQGELIALVCDPGWQQAVAALGVLLAGYAYVPLDASWPEQRIADLLTATGARLLLTHRTAADRHPWPDDSDVLVVDSPPAHAEATPPEGAPPRLRRPEDLAYVIYTSGSTGQPKGVMISHRGALNTVLDINTRFTVTRDDVLLAVSPFTFDLAIYDLFGALAAGATLVVPTREQRADPVAWADLIRRERVTVWNSVPTLASVLLESVPERDESLNTVRLFLLSGDWIPLDLPDRLRDQLGGCQVVSLGGATEGSIWSILYEIGDVDPEWASIPYGRSMTGQRVEVLDEDLLPCPAWTPGQLHICGHGTALGYWNAPELTDAAFVFDGRTGRRLYRTGDWGRLRPDGTIEFLGRRDDQVKIRGYRVEVREVEAAVLALDGVEQVAVVITGERTERRLHAFVVSSLPSAELRTALAERLPTHMLPATLTPRPELPTTATGKIDRAALAREALTLIPHQAAPGPRALGDGELTSLLHGALTALLPAPAGLDEDLLSMGLTSIDVIRLANTVEQHGIPRPGLAAFYRTPTLRTLLQDTGTPADGGHAPAATQWSECAQLTGPDERAAFRAARPAYPAAPTRRILPDVTAYTQEVRQQRFTPREFTRRSVSAQAFSHLLDSLRRVETPGRSGFLYPSAGGLYSVHLYIHIRPGRLDGLDGGVYAYHPEAHDLVPLAPGVDLDPATLHLGPVNRPLAETAAFTLWLVTHPADSAPLYGADAEQLALLNAGYMGQLLCERAREAELGLCPVHGTDFDTVRWLLPDGDRLVLLHTLLGGIPATRPQEQE
ncbi:amino acid adenylation domain-containing protein (plasmid) [Streptomyces sp. NBC_00637]|uniref:amino acid adenylation domain-containing protein n=1 Tax=Streptomyces sp. NBC_00637 TaxID=2903667 RepID=UPI002F910B55